jgi:phosphoribosylaminoimidazole carboxylase PurE protein
VTPGIFSFQFCHAVLCLILVRDAAIMTLKFEIRISGRFYSFEKKKQMVSEKTSAPQVAVVMGSNSDMQVMQGCVDTLSDFGIQPVVRIISAHRTPQIAAAFAENAANNGIKVIIAGAGMAAHLAGALAAHTTLPVIGVPLVSAQGQAGAGLASAQGQAGAGLVSAQGQAGAGLASATGLNGIDALLSTVQMPPGVPVATMAIGKAGAKNAAILAVQILGLSDDSLARKLADFKNAQQKKVIEKDTALQEETKRHSSRRSASSCLRYEPLRGQEPGSDKHT